MYQSLLKQITPNAKLLVGSLRQISKNENIKQQHSNSLASSVDSIDDLKKTNNKKFEINFENSEIAFKSKSNLDLLRGLLVFQLCSLNILVDNQHLVSVDLKNVLSTYNIFLFFFS
jgi:hypothetical protein